MTASNHIDPVLIYTDGACRGNPGPGGWGAVISKGRKVKELHGGERNTTNNRMELTAAIEALKALKKPLQVRLHSDSTYVIKGAAEWLQDWKLKGWKGAGKKPIANQDLWQEIDRLISIHDIEWVWVKGHNGDLLNERADALANLGVLGLTH
jgi:ribonuclease HI